MFPATKLSHILTQAGSKFSSHHIQPIEYSTEIQKLLFITNFK